MYTDHTSGVATATLRQVDYEFNPTVYGTTSTGAKVVLRGTPLLGATVDSSDFTVVKGANGGASDNVEVVANTLADATKTGSSTTLSVTLMGADGAIHTVTTPIKSSTSAPVASALGVTCDTSLAGISQSDDVITVTLADADALGIKANNYISKYDATSGNGTHAAFYFAPTDQYGQTSMPLSQVVVVSDGGTGLAVDSTGMITIAPTATGTATISAVVGGLVKTIQVTFK